MSLRIETPRLALRPFEERDVEPLLAIVGDAETMRHYPRPFTREEAAEWVRASRALTDARGLGLLAVELKETGRMIGDCGIVPRVIEGREEMELGWHVRRDHWGRGLAPEAARAVLEDALARLGLARVVSLVRPENTQSARVAEKLGMHVERIVDWKGLTHRLYVSEPRDA